jgi:cytosine/uracil/thiamine/allantoin permease
MKEKKAGRRGKGHTVATLLLSGWAALNSFLKSSLKQKKSTTHEMGGFFFFLVIRIYLERGRKKKVRAVAVAVAVALHT